MLQYVSTSNGVRDDFKPAAAVDCFYLFIYFIFLILCTFFLLITDECSLAGSPPPPSPETLSGVCPCNLYVQQSITWQLDKFTKDSF